MSGKGAFSLLGPMSATPYAVGERPGPSYIPMMPLLTGQDAFDSLQSYYPPARTMDTKLNPHTRPLQGAPRSTNNPHTKTANLARFLGKAVRMARPHLGTAGIVTGAAGAAAAGKYMTTGGSPTPGQVPSPLDTPTTQPAGPVSDLVRDHGGKMLLAGGGLAALLYAARSREQAEEEVQRGKLAGLRDTHPLVAGFLQSCNDDGLDAADTQLAVKRACEINQHVKLAFDKVAFGGMNGLKSPIPTGGGLPGGIPEAAVPSVLKSPAVKAPTELHPAGLSFAKDRWGAAMQHGQGQVDAAANQGAAARLTAPLRQNPLAFVSPQGGAGMANSVAGPTRFNGALDTATGLLGVPPPNPGALERAATPPTGGGLISTPQSLPQEFGSPESRARLQLPYPEGGPPSWLGNKGRHFASLGMTILGQPPESQRTGADWIQAYNGSVNRGEIPDHATAVNAIKATPQQVIDPKAATGQDGPPPTTPDAPPPGTDAKAITNQALGVDDAQKIIQTNPEQAQGFMEQAGQLLTERMGQAKEQITSWLPQLEAGETPLDLVKRNAEALATQGIGPERTAILKGMDPWQHVALWGGLGLGAIGLISSMTGQGGLGSWLMSLLGLGAAAGVAGHAGLLGQGAQQMTGQAIDKVKGVVNGPASPPAAGKEDYGTVISGMSDTALGPGLKMLASSNPAIASQLDRAAGVGGLGNQIMGGLGSSLGITNTIMGQYGIPPEQSQRIINAWRQLRQQRQSG